MKLRIITAATILLAMQSGSVFAGSTLQGSVGLNYDTTDYSNNDKDKSIGVDLEYYLPMVEKKSHPWREAAFLEHASSINFEVNKETSEPNNSEKFKGHSFSAGGIYASKANPFAATLIYNNTEIKADYPTTSVSQKQNLLGLGAGAYVTESLAVLGLYINGEFKYTVDNFPQFNSKTDVTAYGVLGKYVYELPQQQALNVEFQFTKLDFKPENSPTESNNSVDLKAMYYINPQIGIGGQLVNQSGDTDSFKGMKYGVGVDAFVTENISVTAGYLSFSADNSSGNDSDEWKISAAWWF